MWVYKGLGFRVLGLQGFGVQGLEFGAQRD